MLLELPRDVAFRPDLSRQLDEYMARLRQPCTCRLPDAVLQAIFDGRIVVCRAVSEKNGVVQWLEQRDPEPLVKCIKLLVNGGRSLQVGGLQVRMWSPLERRLWIASTQRILKTGCLLLKLR